MEKQYLENLTKISQLLLQKKNILNPPNTSQDPIQEQPTNQIQSITTIDSELNSLKETNDKLIIDLNQLNDRIQTKLSNKTAIGQNFLTIIDQFGNKLDTDLGQFENELKGAGDYEAPRGLPPDTEVSGNLPLLCLFHSHVLHALLLIDCFSFNIGYKRRSNINFRTSH